MYKVLQQFRHEENGVIIEHAVGNVIDLPYETAKIYTLQGWVKKADAADRIKGEPTADRVKIQQNENNMDWMCAKAIIIREAIRGLRDVCNGLGSPEVVPWLQKLSDMQGDLIREMRKSASRGFISDIDDGYTSNDTLDYFRGMNAPESYKETWARKDLQWLRETHKGQAESLDTEQKDAAELDDIPGFPSTENKNHCDGCCHYAEHPFAAENSF
ncbi:hypothetical protein [uncultured Candidatus Kuenenia sp.]|uniref:hypothetical protein n=1 Tax=uncultured Candidatus Kuenenia sp. TaxID=1048336 RepID=UPI0002FD554D|nr:hypothetical protein [uncultured Candidatus Kuenenia sp.]